MPAGTWTKLGAGSLAILPYEAVRTASDPKKHPAGVLPERLRGRCPSGRLGYHKLRLDLVPHPGPAPGVACRSRRRPRPRGSGRKVAPWAEHR
jgi:hypothetical protein